MNALQPVDPAFESSVFFIPTNRDCARAVASYLDELEFALKRFGRTIPLVVSETNQDAHVSGNAKALADAAQSHPEIPVFHLTVPRQHRYFDLLLRDEPETIRELFSSQGRNYGTAMNKLYLMTASFGADALHRRDSDTRLLSDELPEAAGMYPIELELSYLGRPASQVAAACSSGSAGVTGGPSTTGGTVADVPVCVVGGNYFGEWNLDVKDFARRSYDIVHHLYLILGFDPENIVELCKEVFPAEQVYDRRDVRTLVRVANESANPDCGNVAITRIHEWLPNVPSRNNPAADYFSFDSALAMGIPSLHHTRMVFHEYHAERFDLEQKQVYWEGVARFGDYFNVYGPLFEPDAVGRAGKSGRDLFPAELLEALDKAVGALPGTDANPRVARIRAIAEEVLIPFDDRYARIGRHLLDNAERYVREADEDYAKHQLLLQRWPGIVERAKDIDLAALVAEPPGSDAA